MWTYLSVTRRLLMKKVLLRKNKMTTALVPLHIVLWWPLNKPLTRHLLNQVSIWQMFVPVVPVIVAFFQNKISHRHNPMAMMNYWNQRYQCVPEFVKQQIKYMPFSNRPMTLFKKRNQMSMYWMKQVCFLHGYVCVCCAFFSVLPVTMSQTIEERPDECKTTCGRVDIQEEQVDVEILDEAGVCVCMCVCTQPHVASQISILKIHNIHRRTVDSFTKPSVICSRWCQQTREEWEGKLSAINKGKAFYHSFVCVSHSSLTIRKM